MSTVTAEPISAPAPLRRRVRRKWVLVGIGTALLTAFIVLANVWAAYQPLEFGGTSGGGDGRLGEGNPFYDPATLIIGTTGHVTHLGVSLYNNGRFDVTIDRIVLPSQWLQTIGVDWAGSGGDQPLRFPDKIPAHQEHDYWLTVRVADCVDPGDTSGFRDMHVFFHALGDAHSAWIPIRGGVALQGKAPCRRG